VTTQGFRVVSGAYREHLPQHLGGHSIENPGGEMRLKLIQLRRRPAMRWPTMASFVTTTPGTTKSGKPYRRLTEKRRDRMVPVVLDLANAPTASAVWPPNGVPLGRRRNDLLLEASKQPLPFGQGQTQIGDIDEIIGPGDLHDIG
jgi:hypothetical protein